MINFNVYIFFFIALDILSYGKQGYPSSSGYDPYNNYYPVGGHYPSTYYNQRYPQNGYYPSGTGYQTSSHGYPNNYYPDNYYPNINNKLNPFNWLNKFNNAYPTSPTYFPGSSNCIGSNCYNFQSRYPGYSRYPSYSTTTGYPTGSYPTGGYPDPNYSGYEYSTGYTSRGNGGYGGYYGNGGLNSYSGYDGYYNAGNRPGNVGYGYHQARFLPGGTPSSFPSVDSTSGPLPAITTPHSVSKDAK